jgi:hypothetical protein
MKTKIILAVICIALAAVLVTRGGSTTAPAKAATTLDTTRVADSIQSSILTQRNLPSTVKCPGTVPQRIGVTFTCVATTHRSRAPHTAVRTMFAVTVRSATGYATYLGK